MIHYQIFRIFILIFWSSLLYGQQDPMYAEYVFNQLAYNPAYAGSKEHMAAGIIHRTQWWKIQQAPQTQSFYLHAPLSNRRVGLGLTGMQDQIGINRTYAFYGHYAYRIPLEGSVLSIGIRLGADHVRQDLAALNLQEAEDEAFAPVNSRFMPNAGVGIYFQSDHLYAGLGVPRMLEPALINTEGGEQYGKLYRHYYFHAGGIIPLAGNELLFKPSMLVRTVGIPGFLRSEGAEDTAGGPVEIDIDLSVFMAYTIWVGTSLRVPLAKLGLQDKIYQTIDFWGAYYFDNGLRIGGSFDYSISPLQRGVGGSFELFVGYEFDIRTSRMATPRYF